MRAALLALFDERAGKMTWRAVINVTTSHTRSSPARSVYGYLPALPRRDTLPR